MIRPVDNPSEYVNSLIDLCKQNEIKIIIPVIDPEIDILAKFRDIFIEEGIFVSVSPQDVLDVCYNKSKMNEFLFQKEFKFPKTYYSLETFEEGIYKNEVQFPAMIKPIWGSGSIETYKVESIEQMKSLWHVDMMIQEFIDGQEYGVDVFNNLEGKPIRCVVKKKITMRSGETDKALIEKNYDIQAEIIRLANELKHICNLDCDVIVKDNLIYVIDLNPRFGGGYPATHMSGVDYLELVLKLAQGETVTEDFMSYNDGILVMKEIKLVTKRI